ncbi:MAG TPA: hypothetical protein VFQ60_01130, partial [Patescibacteria group bacterium]|nr:hypothetical protein [Patescibacteria group bacterium]
MPSHPLKNPFEIPKERDPNHKAFVKSVLGKGNSAPKIPKENFGAEADLVLSTEDQKKIEDERIFSKIITRESRALRRFFGKEIHVPPLPPEITAEKIRDWETLDLHLHYLPREELVEINRDDNGTIVTVQPKNYPGWKEKPQFRFFNLIERGKLPPESAHLFGGWVLIEARPKPAYDKGNQKYPNDFLGPVLEELNKKGIIKQTYNDRETLLDSDSRFGISPNELNKRQVKKAIAQAMRIPGGFSLPRAIEFNILGNLYYPEWGDMNTSEWFGDRYDENERILCLLGGRSNEGGLSYIDSINGNDRYTGIGFRVMARFSPDQAKT